MFLTCRKVDPRGVNWPVPASRFFAAAPLMTSDGQSLGALCVFDREPLTVSPAQVEGLVDLAAMLMGQAAMTQTPRRIDTSSGLPNRAQFIVDLEALAPEDTGRAAVGGDDRPRQSPSSSSVRCG